MINLINLMGRGAFGEKIEEVKAWNSSIEWLVGTL